MNDEHSYHIDYHARAFTKLWRSLDNDLAIYLEEYSKVPTCESDQEEKFYMGIFVAAAGSHIQIVSACTLLESLITKEFQQYGKWFKEQGIRDHFRWKESSDLYLNPRVVFNEAGGIKDRNNFIDGHIQLCEACGIDQYLNSNFTDFLRVMMFYRNYIVHNGLEWGKKNIQEFKSKVGSSAIEKYFTKATSGKKDWIYIARPETVQTLREHINNMIHGLDEMFWNVMFTEQGRKVLKGLANNA